MSHGNDPRDNEDRFAFLQTTGQALNVQECKFSGETVFWYLGRDLALSANPAGAFAWAAAIFRRAAGIRHPPQEIERLVLQNGRQTPNHVDPLSCGPPPLKLII